MRRTLWLLLLVLVIACGDDGDMGGAGVGLRLADGTLVEVGAAGEVRLVSLGRTVFATAASGGPRLSFFSETSRDFAALWVFERQNEERLPVNHRVEARQAGDTVEIRYESDDGSAVATLTFSTLRPGEATRARLEIESPTLPAALGLGLLCDDAAEFHGFGEQYNATNQRGEAFTVFLSEQGIGRDPGKPVLFTNGGRHTTYFPMPYFLDPRGFGLLLETAKRVEVDLCASDPGVAWLEVVGGESIEATVFHGPTALDVIRQLGDEVGRPKSPPAWAYGLWVGAQGGTEVVRQKAGALRANDVPARVLWVQDWTGVRRNFGGGFGVQYRWTADEQHYPNLAGLIADLKEDGFRFLSYVNPFVDASLGHFPEMDERGLLIRDDRGETLLHLAPSGTASHPDLTNPEAREYVKGFFRSMVRDLGMDGWMADFAEWVPLTAFYSDGSDPVEAHNRYPIEWHRLSREVMDELRPDGDWAVFGRSGFTGVQAVSMIHWAGDQQTDFGPNDGLPTVVPALLNLGLSGVPYVTHDIAGFSGSAVPARTKELFQRWTELGAFTPIMRTHEGERKTENWQWDSDPETIAHFRRFARVHDALGPELQALAAEAAATSAPILRHLMLVFPDDTESRRVFDQFLVGNDLLVAPVLEQGAVTRRLYLPPGTWYHVWTGEPYTGGRRVEVSAPIGSPPVFSRGQDRPDLREIE